ncbi:hypothetical protein Z043_121949 [Scleropages formosus]|uniref:Cilium assembly protein DZIP1 N-terminal domain-containing protein n=1 Tax=Scleropages formosus TaxID=113540 RepID=A0A0P7TQK8_SCLFO|nr:hypothetical protein Z043_121949 [Scleropages formosus]
METFAPRSLVNAHQSLPSLIGQGLLSGVMTVPTIPTFKFRPRLERLDWRRIRTVDVDRVARELDISTLQEHMAGVTFCNVEKEVCPHCQNPIDPVLLKVIQLVQLMVEYLLHWQDHLVISLQAAENKLKSLLQDREQLQKQLEKQADDMQTLKQELKQRKKIIASQEFMITAGLGGYHQEQDQRCKEKELLKALEQWKDEEKERQKAQLEEMREMMLKEFKELSSKNALLQKKLYEMEEDSHKIWLDMTALQEEKVQLSVSMEERHRQDILKLQQQLKKKDEKWAFRMQKVQAMYKQEKEQFLHHLHRLHSSANTEEERNRKLVEKLERELQEQKKLILSQKEQIKKLTLNPPEYAETPMRSRSGNLTTSMAQVVSRLLETRQRSHQPTQESYMSTPPKTSTPKKDFKEESPVQRPRASVTSVRGPDTLPADSDSEWMDGSDAETSHLQLRRHSSQNEDKPQGTNEAKTCSTMKGPMTLCDFSDFDSKI